MSASKIYVFCAHDSLAHQPAIKEILNGLTDQGCIAGYNFVENAGAYEAAFGKIQTNDLALLLLTNGLVSSQAQLETGLKELLAKKSKIKLAEILIDNVPYDNSFTILPSDLVPVTARPDPASAWSSIRKVLEGWFPKTEKRRYGFVKYVIAGAVLLILAIWLWPKPDTPPPYIPTDEPAGAAKPVIEKLGEFTYGGDGDESVTSIAPTSDGGALLAGSSNSQPTNGQNDFRVVRIDADGNVLWEKNYGGAYDEFLTTVITIPDGFLLGGLSYSANDANKESGNYGQCDFWIVKIDHSGTKLWDRSFGGNQFDIIEDMVMVGDGFLLGGYSGSQPGEMKTSQSQGTDFWLVKTNTDGVKIWDKSYGGSGEDFMNDMSLEPETDMLMMAGYAQSVNKADSKDLDGFGEDDFWTVITDLNGVKIADSKIGGSKTEKAFTSAFNKNTWIGGESNSAGGTGNKDVASAPNHGQSDFYLAKMDARGKKLWDMTYGGSEADVLTGMQETSDGLMLVGHSASGKSGTKSSPGFGLQDGWLVKITPDGKLLFDESFGGAGKDIFYTMARLKDGTYLIAGDSNSAPGESKTAPNLGKSDFWVVKLRIN